ncbi:hypothetical protein AB1285_21030 [Microbacterium sp. NRRL B-14842]|uniref:hypothetical protein n=1 Tax=Microbacterium sp. NRRL B-14842 TaxID=3162881 RepID=UPI003D29804A
MAEELLAAPLADRADVLAARLTSRRVGRGIALGLVVTPRPGAALGGLLAAVDDVVQEWDALTGTPHAARRARRRPRVAGTLPVAAADASFARDGTNRGAGGPNAARTSTPTVGVV